MRVQEALSRPLNPPISLSDYATTFGHACGERVLDDLKAAFHFDAPMFEHGIDALGLAFREGQRSVIIWLLHEVRGALENPDAVRQTHTDGEPQED